MKKGFPLFSKSIKARMLATVAAGVLVLLTVILLNNMYSVNLIEDRLDTTLENMSGMTSEYMELRTTKSDRIAAELARDSEVAVLSSIYLAESDSYLSLNDIKNSVLNKIVYHSEANGEIDSIYLYYENRRSLINSYGTISRTDVAETMKWVRENTNWNKAVLWKEYYSQIEEKSFLSMMYRLDYLNPEIRTPVYMAINFDKNALFDFLDRIKLTKNSLAGLVNFDDNVYLMHSDSETVVDLKTKLKSITGRLKAGESVPVSLQGLGKCVIRYAPMEKGRSGIIHIVPEEEIRSYMQSFQPFILAAAVILAILFILILYSLINKDIDKPVKILIKHMKKLEAGRFSDKIEEERTDEFGSVFNAYNNMTVEVEKLIQELYQEKLVKREMELKILQEKINPHFLYNTLDTINWIAKENDVEDISKMVIALSTMYRKTFNRGRDLISIEDVMTSISCYLDIQKIRYGDTFDYEIECTEDTKDLEILNLIIQTLVENAIVHGMDGKKKDGKIVIRAVKDEERLIVEVGDNGKGIEEGKLKLINASINSKGLESESGLRNVQKRIKLYYGNDSGIIVESEKGVGTTVRVDIPAIKAKDD